MAKATAPTECSLATTLAQLVALKRADFVELYGLTLLKPSHHEYDVPAGCPSA